MHTARAVLPFSIALLASLQGGFAGHQSGPWMTLNALPYVPEPRLLIAAVLPRARASVWSVDLRPGRIYPIMDDHELNSAIAAFPPPHCPP